MKRKTLRFFSSIITASVVICNCSVTAFATGTDITMEEPAVSENTEVVSEDQNWDEDELTASGDNEEQNTDLSNENTITDLIFETESDVPQEEESNTDNPITGESMDEEETDLPALQASVAGEWVQESNGLWWYKHADGSYTISDWEYIEGDWFYFDHYGWMKTGWMQLGGKWYYLKNWGAMATGWLQIEDNYYYFYESGIMATGWFKYEGKWFYLKSWGGMAQGWLQIEDKWYYFYNSGIMAVGWVQLEDKWYYFYPSGAMATSWAHIGEAEYYFYSSGVMATGWEYIGVNYYYFLSTGVMVANQWKLIGEGWYYFRPTGVMATGWLELGGKKYYCKSTGVRVNGDYQIGDIPYHFGSDGVLDLGQSVVNYAMQFEGNPYVWGGESLTNGCDCSGFTMKIYEKFGIVGMPHQSTSQRSWGDEVGSLAAAKPGDLLCFENHVGIYMGNGKMINASNKAPYPEGGIKVSTLAGRTIITIRRLV